MAAENFTIFQPGDAPLTQLSGDPKSVEVGVKFRSTQSGYITAIRFYKGSGATGTHSGHLWRTDGTLLREAVFTNETASGWQQVAFSAPVAIEANTTYVASYFASAGNYSASRLFFVNPVINGPLKALAEGEDGSNGVYKYTAEPALPTSTYESNNYWVDIVFTTDPGPDVIAPRIASVFPVSGTLRARNNTVVKVTFDEPVDPTSVTPGSFQLKDAANNTVAATRQVTDGTVTLTPSAVLNYAATYTVVVTGIRDPVGNTIADSSWTFRVGEAPIPAPIDGHGGPILVVSTASNPFSRYPVEILRAEGLNEFAAKDISQVTAAELNNYQVVVLGEVPLTASQVTLFSEWVNNGGTLVAFKPDVQLSSLLGITKVSGSLPNQYLLVNTASGPGTGIVNETIQFHGAADLYTLNGATSLATLYSNATTATANPAVTTNNVGSNGGKAVAFTYDLARSIVYTRQGNPAWEKQSRDGQSGPIRSDNLFFGATEPDWVNFDKIAIPQADEQQHLLTNIILQNNLHRMPLPRFWFLPSGHKAAIVMTGDDHAHDGTTGRFNHQLTLGPNTPQDVADWKAVRSTSYVWNGTPITPAEAAAFEAQGFEIALHLRTGAAAGALNGCENYTPASYETDLDIQLRDFAREYPGIALPVTNRTHCIAFSDWSTQPKVEADFGIRIDANYYYWPASWVQNRPGMFTGSGMPMRFADLDGSLINCYQLTTQLTDESGIEYQSFTQQLLDKALGPEGYYGVFCANMHTDSANHDGSNKIITAALQRNVPVIAAKQLLTWLDGRDSSYFSGLTWNNNQLAFSITRGVGAHNLKTMVPAIAGGKRATGVTRNGAGIPFSFQTIKGIEYLFFDVALQPGNYVVSYTPDVAAPVITDIVAVPNINGTATITWNTNENADSRVDYGTAAGNLNLNTGNSNIVTAHSVTLGGLSQGTTYYFRVTSKDLSNNAATAPALPAAPLSFTIPVGGLCASDITFSDFSQGTPDANATVIPDGNGGVALKLSLNEDFNGTAVPAGWTAENYNATGTTTVGGGQVTVSGAHVYSNTSFAPGTSIEFVATFTNGNFQNIGFSADQPFNNDPWITIGQSQTNGSLFARAFNGTSVNLGANLLGTAHRYRIKWNSNNFEFYIDGSTTPAATISVAIVTPLYVQLSDFQSGDGILSIDWLRATPYLTPGSFTSRIFDGGTVRTWSTVTWNSAAPAGTTLAVAIRTGNTPVPDASWTEYATIPAPGAPIDRVSRYIQYKADLVATDNSSTPVLKDISFLCADVTNSAAAKQAAIELQEEKLPGKLQARILPNPSTTNFRLVLSGGDKRSLRVNVLDVVGKTLEKYPNVPSNSTLSFGQSLPNGIYFVEIIQGSEKKLIKVIKNK